MQNKLYVPYPPIPYFPRNPDIPSKLGYGTYTIYGYKEEADTIQARSGKQLSSRKDSLEFSIGSDGKRNVIKLPSHPYVNYNMWDGEKWLVPNTNDGRTPIQLFINTFNKGSDDSLNATLASDNTNYFSKEISKFSQEAATFDDNFVYFFDGSKIITNFDFSNPSDRERITVGYYKLTDTIRVKSVITSNSPGISFFTPSVDQYTLVVGKQRIAE